MIDESFVQASIKIRRTYLKLTNNMDFYKTQAERLSKNLDDIVGRLQKLQLDLNDDKKNIQSETAISEVTKILKSLDDEGKSLEGAIDPINDEIEKLSIEEQELWRMIKEKHYDLPEDDIINYIKQRLIDANLSS